MKSLFNAKTISRLCGNVVISDVQRSGAEKWLRMLADGELYDERHNYINFYQIILHDILGYDETDIKYEENNVEFQIKSADRKPILCCETKGTRIADLYADQHRPKKEHRTPIDQTHYYMYRLDLEYGLCTNYNKFVLLDRNKNAYEFDFELIQSSKSKLKEFVGMFSKTNVLSGFFENVRHESELEEREFTKQFYKLFHETRLMMIKEFSQNAEKSIAVHHTQIILNRLVFIFFAADRDLVSDRRLFYNRLIGIFKSNTITDTSQKVFDDIRDVFTAFDKGSKMPEIFSYNGGLFSDEMPPDIYFKDIQNKNLFANLLQDSKLSKQKLNQDAENAIKSITNLNPIIRNLMIMESFNFNTEVSVNILGHIFEQSISDLETIEGKAASQRKKSGIYYTPRHITDYICRNTIIPYLSKSGMADTVFALMDEYNDAGGISDLEQKFREIKILDPACGSGAFILPAVGILLDIGKAIINHKQSRGLYTVGEQSLLTKWSEESEMERIIENNVYGVDIYRQSIEITKLSLCLELVSKNRKLPDLGKNFRIGNSVVDNEKIDSQAFDWDNEFPDVMKGGGFGVVIGNPPYVKSRDNIIGVKMKKSIEERFVSAFAMWDLYVPFMELGLMLLKNDGWFAMIVKDTLGEANYTKKLIELIENKYHLHQIDFFPGIMLFEGVGVENKIPFIQNSKKTTLAKRILHNTPSTTGVKLKSVSGEKKYVFQMPKFTISRKNTLGLGDICLTSYGLRLNSDTDDKEKFQKKDLVSKKRNKTNSRVYTEGKYLEKYCITKELFVEWETERCPNRLVRPTFPQLYEPEKLLMSRQKRIAAYSDSQHICDNTIIVGVLAKDLKKVQNSNIRKYYQNLELPRTEIEENSRRFNLKYILVILNSNLISYFLKHNSGGKIDSYPDDWKKVPIKILPKDKQKNYVKKADMLLDLNSKLSGDVSAFLKQVKAECGLDRTPRILRTFYDMDDAVFMALLAKHKRMSLDEKDGWYRYFEQCKKKALDIKIQIVEIENKVNTMVYKLYGLTDEEIKVVENAIAGNHKQ